MNKKWPVFFLMAFILCTAAVAFTRPVSYKGRFISYKVNLKKQHLELCWKDDQQQPIKSISRLKDWLGAKKQQLVFAMNAGMYKTDNSPLGLFIQDQKIITPLNTKTASGNFYLKPNGVFYTTTDNKAVICRTEDFAGNEKIKYATQSGPMLLINGQIHAAFQEGSSNINIRNGVGNIAQWRSGFCNV